MLKGFFDEIFNFLKELFKEEEFWLIIFILGITGFVTLPFIDFEVLLKFLLKVIFALWWLWFFLILFSALKSLILFWRRELFKSKKKFVVLEIKFPSRPEKSAENMDLFLSIINGYKRGPSNVKDKYWDGVSNNIFSLEIVYFDGKIHFFIVTPKDLKDLVEKAFLSYYPYAELEEVDDYTKFIPANEIEMQLGNFVVAGSEFILSKPEAYPIKTYKQFEVLEEKRRIDPLSTFLEFFSKLKKDNFLGIQILIEPVGSDWKNKYTSILEGLKKKNTRGGDEKGFLPLSPGELDVLKAVESNLSKPAFLTLIRMLYFAPKESQEIGFAISGVASFLGQYSSNNLNSFGFNPKTGTYVNVWKKPLISMIYAKKRLNYKINRIIFNYRKRIVPPDTFWGNVIYSYPFAKARDSKRFYFSTESLASLFHIPTTPIPADIPLNKMVVRKVPPPSGLLIFGEEEELKKFE
jgi:hypothetical protein